MPISTPRPLPEKPEVVITAEAGLNLDPQMDLRVEPLAQVGEAVAQGAPILRDRRRPECVITAPMAARIAEMEIGAGRRLGSVLLYREDGAERHRYDTREAQDEVADAGGTAGLRRLLQASGLWMRLRARPFGRTPAAASIPSAIFVMAADTRPLAADPRLALAGEGLAQFALGLRALARLCDGPIHLCQDRGPDILPAGDGLRIIRVGPLHPAGLAGFLIHRLFPAGPGREVWDIDAEDVAAIGALLTDGQLPATRLVSVAGPGMSETRLLRCQPGADLREICHAHMSPGQNLILSGSMLDGVPSRWLGFRHRQVTVIRRPPVPAARHWLQAALYGASRPEPVIATAAVREALGGLVPGMALLRALSVGDDEAAAELGALSLLEEDLALVDYVTSAAPRFSDLLRASLDRMEGDA